MCDPLLPIDELKRLKFSLNAMASLHDPGSYKKQLAEDAARGINERLEWVIRQLEHAGEGKKNFGL